MTLLALAVLCGFALYVMKPAERRRLLEGAVRLVAKAAGMAAERAAKQQDPFTEALRERTRWALIVPAIITYNVVVFVCMLFGSGAFSDPDTLVAWGGNFGPRTTNGEWGRLMVSMFVHGGFLHLLATMAGLIQVGLIMERLVGYVTFSAVYLMAGFFASVVSLWLHPMEVSVGASGAVFGIYGFVAAASIWGMHRSTGVTIPLQTVKTFAPAAGLFILYNAVSGGLQFEAELAAFAAGFVSGLVLTQEVGERQPAPRRVVGAVAATFAVAACIAIPLHGITDIRPEIEWIVRLEDGTAARYETAVERFRKGVISGRELAKVIDRSIVPELESARTRLTALGRVPREHQALLARAQEFLRLRDECWRLRAEALQANNMATLREADRVEMTSLAALEGIKPAVRQ
jgi:membrane associated rhomboid family serine protease